MDFKLDLNMEGPFMPLIARTIYWQLSLKGRKNHGHESTEFIFVDNSLLKEKILYEDHNGETNG